MGLIKLIIVLTVFFNFALLIASMCDKSIPIGYCFGTGASVILITVLALMAFEEKEKTNE